MIILYFFQFLLRLSEGFSSVLIWFVNQQGSLMSRTLRRAFIGSPLFILDSNCNSLDRKLPNCRPNDAGVQIKDTAMQRFECPAVHLGYGDKNTSVAESDSLHAHTTT